MQDLGNIIEQAAAMFSELGFLQNSYRDRLKQEPQQVFNSEGIAQGLAAGETLLSRYDFASKAGLCQELQQELCRLIAKHRNGKEKQVEKVSAYLGDNQYLYEAFLRDRHPAVSGELSLEEQELLHFVLAQSMRPFLQVFAEQCSTLIDQEQWLRDYCPVCGEKATLSYLRAEDSRRMLVCPLCGNEWLYKYLACTWCGNDDHQGLSFFEVAEMPAYEVYLCEKCHGYLKTYNEKKGAGHRAWPLEDVSTLMLDVLAMNQGYSNPGNKAYM